MKHFDGWWLVRNMKCIKCPDEAPHGSYLNRGTYGRYMKSVKAKN